MGQWQPGDALMTTRLGLPAVWWYGMIPISDEAGAGKVLRDGSPVYEAGHTNDCPSRQLEDALQNHRRVLLYLGFDGVSAVDYLLLRNLAELGGMTAHRRFAQLGRAAVIDLRLSRSDNPIRLGRPAPSGHVAEGCVGVRQAERW